MKNTQQTFDNIPAPIKSILIKSLYISIRTLKDEGQYGENIDGDTTALIESMQFIENKLTG
jgi:hypothetical protein